MKILDGKIVSQKIKDELKSEIQQLENNKPKLVVIMVGDNPASLTYVKNKEKACKYIGINSETIKFPENIDEKILIQEIIKLNKNDKVNGILVQLPLPPRLNKEKIIQIIDPQKDVDGFHPLNVAKLTLGEEGFIPCTTMGIYKLLDYYNYDIQGKHIVIVGRSDIVGKPTALFGLKKNATITICHSKTKNLKEICKTADILICTIGKAKFITKEYVTEKTIVIDVGINKDENNKLCGDVDFENIKNYVQAITPVPGGIGPMTIAMLMENTMKTFELKQKILDK